uniref:Predicted protein n=1 Tax=Hordeum vulgare subsp. vulgare TaxID=112509 RepID=F2DBL5_HORVV|nr:predicted protein [Hordeum vulgare subsp. vulgare]
MASGNSATRTSSAPAACSACAYALCRSWCTSHPPTHTSVGGNARHLPAAAPSRWIAAGTLADSWSRVAPGGRNARHSHASRSGAPNGAWQSRCSDAVCASPPKNGCSRTSPATLRCRRAATWWATLPPALSPATKTAVGGDGRAPPAPASAHRRATSPSS